MPPIPDSIIGHESQVGQLLGDIAHCNVTHAYLFVGPPHIGKFTIARWFAWRLLADGMAPEAVEPLRDHIERLIQPDLLVLDRLWIDGVCDDWKVIAQTSNAPQVHRSKGTPAKTDTISIDDIRALHERLLGTGDNRHFCCLIRSAERMQDTAATAFLKLLEEPPPRVVFVLTAETEHAVLPTIASRTRIVRFSRLPANTLTPLLAGRQDDDAAFALHLAEGAPGRLVGLLSNPDLLRSERQLHAQAKHFWQATGLHERLKWLLPFAEDRSELQALLKHLGHSLREHANIEQRSRWTRAYSALVDGLQTNAQPVLQLQRFTLAVSA